MAGNVIELLIRGDASGATGPLDEVRAKTDQLKQSSGTLRQELTQTRQGFIVLGNAIGQASNVVGLMGVDVAGFDRALMVATGTMATATQAAKVFQGGLTGILAQLGPVVIGLAALSLGLNKFAGDMQKANVTLLEVIKAGTIWEAQQRKLVAVGDDVTKRFAEFDLGAKDYHQRLKEVAKAVGDLPGRIREKEETDKRAAEAAARHAEALAKLAQAAREAAEDLRALLDAERTQDEVMQVAVPRAKALAESLGGLILEARDYPIVARAAALAQAELNVVLQQAAANALAAEAAFSRAGKELEDYHQRVRRMAQQGAADAEQVISTEAERIAKKQADAILLMGPSEEAVALLEQLSDQYDAMGAAGENAGKIIRAALIQVLILLGKLPAGVQAGTDALTEWGKTLENLTRMGEGFLSLFLQGTLNLEDAWQTVVRAMADQWANFIIQAVQGKQTIDKLFTDILGGLQGGLLSAAVLVTNFGIGKKKAAEQARQQALDEARKVAQLLADMVRAAVVPALQEAFDFNLLFGVERAWENFTLKLRRQLFEQIKAGVIEAFIASAAVQAAMGPLMAAIKQQIAIVSATGVFDPAAFAAAIGPAINLFNATLGTLQPLFAAVFAMLQGVGMGLGVFSGPNPFAGMGIAPVVAAPPSFAPPAIGEGVGEIPHLQGGGFIRRGGLAMLHAGETVLPAGGGDTFVFNLTGPFMGNELEADRFTRQVMERIRRQAGRA